MSEVELKRIRKTLEEIKKLLILNAIKSGITSEKIGKCLGVGGSRVRNIVAGMGTKREDEND